MKQVCPCFECLKVTLLIKRDKNLNLPWTFTQNLRVTVPMWLLAEQMYSPPSKVVVELMMKTLLWDKWGPCEGYVQLYKGLGFPLARQRSRRGSPSEMLIESFGDTTISGLSVSSFRQQEIQHVLVHNRQIINQMICWQVKKTFQTALVKSTWTFPSHYSLWQTWQILLLDYDVLLHNIYNMSRYCVCL